MRDDLTRSTGERWRAAVNTVREGSVRYATSLAFGRLIRLAPGEVRLNFPREAGFHRSTVTGAGKALIEQALTAHFGRITQITEAAASETPEASVSLAEEAAKDRADHERSVDSKVREHPAVQAALRVLGGQIEHVEVFDKDRPPASEPDLIDEGA